MHDGAACDRDDQQDYSEDEPQHGFSFQMVEAELPGAPRRHSAD
jgi:hypothetical protein